MITVQLNKDDFSYDIHSLVKAFFPSENVSVFTAQKAADEPVQLRIYVDYAPRQVRLAVTGQDQQERQEVFK